MTDTPFFERTVLPNGLRILTSSMPHTHSVALSVYVGTGSRYEKDSEAGVSHFLEHLLFKGTERWPTAKELSETIDGVGGMMNAGTDREYTVYYVKVARPHLDQVRELTIGGELHVERLDHPHEVVAVGTLRHVSHQGVPQVVEPSVVERTELI